MKKNYDLKKMKWKSNQTRAFLEVVSGFPQYRFIVAHGFHFNPLALREAGEHFDRSRWLRRNVFADISPLRNFSTWPCIYLQSCDPMDFVKALDAFGKSWMLYGGDETVGSRNSWRHLTEEAEYFASGRLLSEESAAQIAENGVKFFEELRITR